ncbi:hypothetical protein [Rhizobium sp.]|uniref:hypothetical protein n=1 Tax=Rhizobium sp. TaxID=391 RepID=UPI0028A763AD
MIEKQDFSVSSNGDRWSLEKHQVSGETVVVHEANAPSGGQVTRIPVVDFLNCNVGKPEYEALLQILGQSHPRPQSQLSQNQGETSSYATAMRYLNLGGRRRAKVDDNIVTTRSWESDPSQAEAFWQSNVETLDEKSRRDVAMHLPSISER